MPKTVAVVAIHGVADQQPGDSVRSIGGLLLRLRQGGREVYRGFREIALRIPLRPVRPSTGGAAAATAAAGAETPPSAGSMNERAAYVLDALEEPAAAGGRAATAGAAASVPPHHLFQRSLVEGYTASRGSYRTVRLEGVRQDGRAVHLYELYWADLSRVGQGLLAILGAFYQLALHLPHLGRLTVDHALFEHRGDGAWKRFATVHAWAVRALTLFLPVLVLLLALAVLGLLPGALPAKPWIGIVALAAAGLVAGGRWRYHRRSSSRWRTWAWSLLPIVTAALGGGLGFLLLHFRPGGRPPLLTPDQLLLLLWIALASLVFFLVVGAFDPYRPGIRHWGERAYLLFFLLPMLWATFSGDAGALWDDASRLALASGVLRVFELQLNLTGLVTAVFYLLALLSGWLGWSVVRRAKRGKPRRRARRVVWTAVATLALATVLFYTVTMLISWGALFAARPLLPQAETGATPPHEALLGFNRDQIARALGREAAGRTQPTHAEALELLLRFAATSGITVLVLALVLLGLLAVWGLAPAVWKEVRPPSGETATDERQSESLGRWLDRTYGAFAGALVALYLAAFLVSPAVAVLRLLNARLGWDSHLLGLLWDWNGAILTGAGALVAASAVGLAFHGRLRSLALGFRPLLDVALDVDGYLRHLPGDRTPRARMFERYASLLRHLTAWRDENGEGYDSIVLVAHSQGSVLTADLLDFLSREGDPGLPWIGPGAGGGGPRLLLFTMGSPLAQLYARNFPHLYGWISGEPSAWFPPPAKSGKTFQPRLDGVHHTGDDLPEDGRPDPAELGVERWVNAYRSGDYVGRVLWRDPAVDRNVLWVARDALAPSGARYTVSEDAAGRRRELCLGSGAHTHYWDSTADAVAFELDLLIG